MSTRRAKLTVVLGFSVAATLTVAGLATGDEAVAGPTVRPRVVMHDLGEIGGGAAIDINERGQVVGYRLDADDRMQAVMWYRGRTIDLGTVPGMPFVAPMGINERGQVVGDSWDRGYGMRAWLWERGSLRALETGDGETSHVKDVNNRGAVAGTAGSGFGHAVVWRDGVRIDLGTLGASWSDAKAITDTGVVTGASGPRGWVWRNGVMRDLGSPENSIWTIPSAANRRGQVVGSYETDTGRHPFLWSHGTFRPLDIGSGTGTALSINDRGQVVIGAYQAGESNVMVWDRGRKTVIGHLGGGYTAVGYFSGRDLSVINNRGQVVGASRTATGELHAFIWWRGVMTDLGDLGGGTSLAFTLNDRGDVIGKSTAADGSTHAVLWRVYG